MTPVGSTGVGLQTLTIAESATKVNTCSLECQLSNNTGAASGFRLTESGCILSAGAQRFAVNGFERTETILNTRAWRHPRRRPGEAGRRVGRASEWVNY